MHYTFCNNNNNNPPTRITVQEATEQKLNILLEWPNGDLLKGKITSLLLNSDSLEEVAQFKYLGVTITDDLMQLSLLV